MQKKTLLIGVDGFTWNVVNPLIEKGLLPNIKHLIESGVFGQLYTLENLKSPVIWTSIATGRDKYEHKIEDFVMRVEGKYTNIPVNSEMRKVKAFWNILSENKKKNITLGWYASYPAEKVDGIVISDRIFETEKNSCYPDSYLKYLKEFFNEDDMNTSLKELVNGDENFDIFPGAMIKGGFFRDLIFEKYFLKFLDEEDFDVMAVMLLGSDPIQHYFWKYWEPEKFDEDISKVKLDKYKDTIPRYYIHIDNFLGKVLKKAPLDKYNIIMVSDHGFKEWNVNRYWYHLNLLLLDLGYLYYQKPKNYTKYILKRFIKRNLFFLYKLYKSFKHQPIESDSKNIFEKYKDKEIDWEKTIFYDKSFNPELSLRHIALNLKGREESGIVPPEKTKFYMKKLMKKLEPLKTDNSRDLFVFVRKAGQQYVEVAVKMNASTEIICDNITINRKTYPVSRYYEKIPISGHHKIEGFAIYAGEDFKQNYLSNNLSVLDVTPLLLVLNDLPIARNMKGKVRKFWFDTPPEIKFIDTYETEKRETKIIDKDSDEDVRKKLRALGYIS
ncbi:alkaline phosphatase family protein [Candidatus Dependentiae bacterium]|nr:alkaline phosphatase family protein [Candidatus Dependentiae bacterium]